MRTFSPVFAALFLSTAIAAHAAGPLRKLAIGNWRGGSYTNDSTGAFSHCAASVRYRNGIFLVVSVDRDFRWAIGMMRPSWDLVPGDVLPFHLTFDGRGDFTVNGVVKLPNFVLIDMPRSSPVFRNFEYADQMTAYANGYAFRFNLTSTSELMPALVDCVRSELNVPQPGPAPSTNYPTPYSAPAPQPGPAPVAPQAPMPVAPENAPGALAPASRPIASNNAADATTIESRSNPLPKTGSPPKGTALVLNSPSPPPSASRLAPSGLSLVASGPVEDLHDQAVALARSFIRASHFTAPHILSRAKTPAAFVAFGAAWKAAQGSGAVRLFPADGKTKGIDITAMVIAADAKSCKGQFLSARDSETIDGEAIYRGLSSCKDPAGGRTAEYFVVPRKKGGFALFSVASAADLNGAGALTAGDQKTKLEKAALKASD